MASAERTRLRVAQAARIPVTAARISELLSEDEEAHNLSVAKVEEALAEWIDEGIVEKLPAAEDGGEARYVHRQVWTTELHRRIAGHLLRPRNLASLQAECRADEFIGSFDLDTLQQYLDVILNAGIVKTVGEHADSKSLADAVDNDADTIDLHPSSRSVLIERLDHPRRAWQLEGPIYVLTHKGLDALQVT